MCFRGSSLIPEGVKAPYSMSKQRPIIRRKDDPKPITFTPLQQSVIDKMVDDRLTISEVAKCLNKHIQTVSRIVHLPKIQDELLKRVGQKRGIAALLGYNTVSTLAENAKSEYVRLEAGKDLLDRSGFKAPDRVQIEGEVSINIDLS